MRISWREVLGVLIGAALCYAVISYAVNYAPRYQQAASEQATQEESVQSSGAEDTSRTDPAASYGNASAKTVTVRVTGAGGERFGLNYGNLRSSRTVEGTLPAEDRTVRVRTDPTTGDYAWADAWKTSGDSKELRVQILDSSGKVITQRSSAASYGSAFVKWDPNDKESPTEGTTTQSTGKPKVQ